ncbi:DUF3572 domain-containing protein [Sphingomonas morindae]|uniref:DUF3572 domain-containing protein n=1 Tax=Sphingomonas morindae TaxID=1541170 RepID=A0ABY4X4N1_9SPHN|nr:DUF3572 domain-containing protein [Sphingomonas morindae]USI71805.1 DUF3572 domain-containing protein [Sphingomonas morindae]
MAASKTNYPDATVVALQALAWVLTEPSRADRLLALTGLDADDLRARATEPALLAAVLGFLAGHEPDLLACTEALSLPPEALIAAQSQLESR